MGQPGRFVGVGIDVYDGHQRLEHAVAEVQAVAGLLSGEFVGEPLLDPDQARPVLLTPPRWPRRCWRSYPDAQHVWFGILVSCSAADIGAPDEVFGEALLRLLTEGPQSPTCGAGGRGASVTGGAGWEEPGSPAGRPK